MSQTILCFNLGSVYRKGTVPKDVLEKLSHRIPREWRQVGRRLLIIEETLDEIDDRWRVLHDKAYNMFLYWKQKYIPAATYQVLYDALSHDLVSRCDLAEEFCTHQKNH